MRMLKRVCLTAMLLTTSATAALAAGDAPPVLSVDSPYDTATTVQRLQQAVEARQYRVVRVARSYEEPGTDADAPTVVYFCNFALLHKALERNKEIGPMLPCHIVVNREGDQVTLYAPNLSILAQRFTRDDSVLRGICDHVTQDYKEILDEVTL